MGLHSPYWDDTAIMVLEDDAQDGADHVDAHRSIALVISKYSPGSAAQPYVEHRFDTTVNMVHTLEALLGLPPMNINDAYAPVISSVLRERRSAGVQGRLSKPKKWTDLRTKPKRCGRGEDLGEDGLLASRCRARGPTESRALAGSEGGARCRAEA